MSIKELLKLISPDIFRQKIKKYFVKPSRTRQESNDWLSIHCKDIQGNVLSIGSGDDSDGQGSFYKEYFPMASSYTTSEVSDQFNSDLELDIRSMSQISDGAYGCVYCSGVLEHVDDYQAGLKELTRILASGGILLLGVPFRQSIHMAPNDFWRFTEYGIRYLLRDSYRIQVLTGIDLRHGKHFPATYWVKASKLAKNK